MALDWRCISYWKWGFSSHLLQRWKNTSCLVAALFGPGIASLCLLSPLDRGKPLQGTSPCTSCGVLEIGLTFWDVFGMMLKLPPDTGTNVPNHFSPFMCPSETCWLFLSLSDNLQAMYHLLIIPFDNMFFLPTLPLYVCRPFYYTTINWVVVSKNFCFHPDPWGDDPIWRAYVFKWVGSTTNETIILPIFAVTVDPPRDPPFWRLIFTRLLQSSWAHLEHQRSVVGLRELVIKQKSRKMHHLFQIIKNNSVLFSWTIKFWFSKYFYTHICYDT